MASEEERTKTAQEAPREDTHEDHDDRESEHIEDPRAGTSNHRSNDNFVTTFQLLKGYFDKKFRSLKKDRVEDAESNSHYVAKGGKQSQKHFSTRSGASENYRPLDSSVNPQPITFRPFK